MWAIILSKLINEDSDEIDYLFMMMLLEEWDLQYSQIKKDIIKTMNDSYRDNFNMETDIINRNLIDIGVDKLPAPLYVDYDNLRNPNYDILVEKQLEKFNRIIKSTLLSGFTNVEKEDMVKSLKDNRSNRFNIGGVVSGLLRVYRTESTRLRSRTKLKVVDGLRAMGIKVDLQWVHIMSNTSKNMQHYQPRLDHVAIHGQRANAQGYFELPNGAKAKAPAMFGLPEEDINCQCSLAIVR